MKGRLIDISRGMNNLLRITVEVAEDFRETYERLKDGPVNVEIKRYRKRRSLDANAYAWVLMDKIAAALHVDKAAVYKQTIRNIGGVSDTVCVTEGAAKKLIGAWATHGIGWQSETMPSKIKGCVNVVLYYGSSTYDTKQMSALIDQLVFEAKELGIETMTPEELRLLMEREER